MRKILDWRKATEELPLKDGDVALMAVPLSGGGYHVGVVHVRLFEEEDESVTLDLEENDCDWGWSWQDVAYWCPVQELFPITNPEERDG